MVIGGESVLHPSGALRLDQDLWMFLDSEFRE